MRPLPGPAFALDAQDAGEREGLLIGTVEAEEPWTHQRTGYIGRPLASTTARYFNGASTQERRSFLARKSLNH